MVTKDLIIKDFLSQTISNDYIEEIFDILKNDIIEDLEVAADKNFNDNDLKFAFSRALIKNLKGE